MERIHAAGYRVGNVDVTVIAQKPKLMPYIPQMQCNIAKTLKITESQVNSALVVLFVLFLCLFLTEGMKVRPTSKRQLVAEMLVEKAKAFVEYEKNPEQGEKK